MKRPILSFLLITLALCCCALGQQNSAVKSSASRASTISGKVSKDGRSLIERNGQPWSVTNPEALVGRQDGQVKVKCQITPGSHDIFVLSVKTATPQTTYAVNLGDSAFRR
jgi:hypothetical protein